MEFMCSFHPGRIIPCYQRFKACEAIGIELLNIFPTNANIAIIQKGFGQFSISLLIL